MMQEKIEQVKYQLFYMKRIIAIISICFLSLILLPKPIFAQGNIECSLSQLLPKLESINLTPNTPEHYEFFISSSAEMPNMTFTADFVGDLTDSDKDCLKQQLANKFDWSMKVQYWDGINKDSHKILPNKLGAQRKGLITGDGWEYAIASQGSSIQVGPDQLAEKFGGGADGVVVVKLNLPDKVLTAEKPLQVWAESVDKTQIKLYLGTLEYQLLGYLESKFIHIYNGTPLLNCGDLTCSVSDGGFGLMQMTDCSGTAGAVTKLPTKEGSGHGFPSYRQIWDWKANAEAGKSCYQIKVQYLCGKYVKGSDEQLHCGYSGYNGSRSYGDLGITILNEMRQGRFRAGWF